MPDATSLYHCLKNKQLNLNAFSGKDPAKGCLILYTHRRSVANTWYLHMIVHTPIQLENC